KFNRKCGSAKLLAPRNLVSDHVSRAEMVPRHGSPAGCGVIQAGETTMNGISPVRLKYATSQSFTVDGVSPAYTALNVKVRNIAFMKDVSIHLRGFDGVWQGQPLSWLGNYGDYDLFQRTAAYTEQFVIRYTVNGITYWDNNNGFNYH